ncbi:toll/interleukin-1 receptor domain-containing protein [Algoriphagus antarcticus]|uniref:TIR domain-containing protein n=1 Tax=Algoriphagus antarcticus TaxID=238540 RepID=A0A3E0D915_9BACT|nr:toll/interleukin-1 receptor domain-containing protein [Algoriphagus antarcticus]REG78421.1 TIR domain-containing protein [Algoriphagus antarcticus]
MDLQVVFISYAWGGESESVANEIDQAVTSAGINLVRDKRDLGFKGLIKEFMEQIGQGHAIILVISDKYLKSANCMFELLEVQKSGAFYERVFPLVLPDAAIYKSTGIISYLKYWEDQIEELNLAIKGLDSFADTQGIRDDIDLFTDIRGAIANLAATFRNMNTLTVEEMRTKSFAPLLELLGKKVGTKPKSKYGKVLYHIPEMMQIQEWTRCIVRLAWDELLLIENLKIPEEEQVIDDIRLGEVMQVSLEEGRDGDTFEIKGLSSTEQVILVDDYTEWLFDVKALREGTFTLVLRVTLLQIIEGFGERKKDIVLERNVTTKAFAPEALPVFEASEVNFIPNNPVVSFLPSMQNASMASPPIPLPYPSTAATLKSNFTFRKLMPYAASLLLLCVAGTVMWPEIKNTFEEDVTTSTVINDSDGIQQTPTSTSSEPIQEPQSSTIPPVFSPSQTAQSVDKSMYEFPISDNVEIQLPVSRLVLIGIKMGLPTDGIALEENDFLFLVDYFASDTIELKESVITLYSLEDTVKLSDFRTKEVNVKQIQDSVKVGVIQRNWKMKPSTLRPNRINN